MLGLYQDHFRFDNSHLGSGDGLLRGEAFVLRQLPGRGIRLLQLRGRFGETRHLFDRHRGCARKEQATQGEKRTA